MDEILGRRYRNAFDTYPPSRLFSMEKIKDNIRNRIDDGKIRPDAGLFLLINFDQMLSKAYIEPLRDSSSGQLLPFLEGPRSGSTPFSENILFAAFNIIIENLGSGLIEATR